MLPLKQRELYGGAMTCLVPTGMYDVSDIREIPNTQEVFTHTKTDESLIFDILEYQDVSNDEEAVQVHFAQIADLNDASLSTEILSQTKLEDSAMPNLPGIPKYLVQGRQRVTKFKEDAESANSVLLTMVLIRLPSQTTDIVITFNRPTVISAASSSAGLAVAGQTGDNVTSEDIATILHSFTIVDYGLFL